MGFREDVKRMKALADENRLAIMLALRHGEKNAFEDYCYDGEEIVKGDFDLIFGGRSISGKAIRPLVS